MSSFSPYNFCQTMNCYLGQIIEHIQQYNKQSQPEPLSWTQRVSQPIPSLFWQVPQKVSEDSRLFKLVVDSAEALGQPVPDVYVERSNYLQAIANPIKNKIIFSTRMLEVMDDNELKFVTGHELRHFTQDHSMRVTVNKILDSITYTALATTSWFTGKNWLESGSLKSSLSHTANTAVEVAGHTFHLANKYGISDWMLGTVIGTLMVTSLVMVRQQNQKNEFDADKGGEIAAGNDMAVSALRKMQVEGEGKNWVTKTSRKIVGSIGLTHPSDNNRVNALSKKAEPSESYAR